MKVPWNLPTKKISPKDAKGHFPSAFPVQERKEVISPAAESFKILTTRKMNPPGSGIQLKGMMEL